MRRILVVEDRLEIRHFLRFLLESEGYRVETAGDGIEGLEAVAWFKPELVLLNIEMPRMDGFEVLEALRREPPAPMPRVVMASGSRGADVFERALAMGAVDFIGYPSDADTILGVVESTLDPAWEAAELAMRAKVRRVLEAARSKGAGCASAIEEAGRLRLDELPADALRELRDGLLDVARRGLENRGDSKDSVLRVARIYPGIDPLLALQALASSL